MKKLVGTLVFSKKPAPTAARLCTEWNHNGYKDWYLPSILELKMIFDKGYINHIPKRVKMAYLKKDLVIGLAAKLMEIVLYITVVLPRAICLKIG